MNMFVLDELQSAKQRYFRALQAYNEALKSVTPQDTLHRLKMEVESTSNALQAVRAKDIQDCYSRDPSTEYGMPQVATRGGLNIRNSAP